MATPHSSAALAAIVDISADAMIALDSRFHIVRFNRGAEMIFGWTEQEMLGQPLDRLLPLAVRAIHRTHIRNFSEGAEEARQMADRRTIAGVRRSGEEFPAEASIARVTIEGERTFMVTLRDVSERKRSEDRQRLLAMAGWVLAASLDVESTLATVAELPLPVLADWSLLELLQPDGRIRRVAASHFESTQHEAVISLLTHDGVTLQLDDSAVTGARVAHAGESLRVSSVEQWIQANFPEPAQRAQVESLGVASVLILPLRAGGKALGALHLVRAQSRKTQPKEDIQTAEQYSGLCALALENARLYQEARTAVRERDDMLAIVSHDLRNPVHAIVMLSGALLNAAPVDEKILMDVDQLEAIRSAAQQADGLIQDLQDVTRIAASRFRVEQRRESVVAIVNEATDMFRPAVAEAALTLDYKPVPAMPDVIADRRRILQVLSNLLANAVKFTPAGGTVCVSIGADDGHVRVGVRDSGPGIAADDIPRLFDRYWQAPKLLRAGSGLGLYIAKGIVEANGGHIGVISAPGEGSEFWFTLPLAG